MSSDERAIIWTFVGTLAGFKVLTSVLVFYYFPSWYTFVVLVAINVVWFIPLFYYLPRFFHGRYRLWNVRIKRRRLIEQEWNVERQRSSLIDRR